MTTKTKFAALTAGLLARKGEALPSAHSAFTLASAYDEAATMHEHHAQRPATAHDLGALIERARPQGVPAVAHAEPVAAAPEVLPEAAAVPPPPLPPRAFGLRNVLPPPHERQALPHRRAVSVRLDDARYLRLKLAGWHFHRTSQDILTRALDLYLTAIGAEEVQDEDLARWRAQSRPPGAG
jgi:hypothetical protein